MGGRLTANLRPRSEYSIDYVEISDTGRKRLAEQQIEPVEVEQAISRAEVVILAIPDASIGKVTRQIVPKLRPRTMVFGLDPAAAYAGVMPIREDLTFFVAHPCHPPLFTDSAPADSQSDWFGGRSTLAQSVVGICPWIVPRRVPGCSCFLVIGRTNPAIGCQLYRSFVALNDDEGLWEPFRFETAGKAQVAGDSHAIFHRQKDCRNIFASNPGGYLVNLTGEAFCFREQETGGIKEMNTQIGKD